MAVGQIQLRQLLLWLWDPIGVSDHFPYGHEKYNAYADSLRTSMVEDSDERTRAFRVQREVRRAQMAMGLEREAFALEDRRNLTEMILAWRRGSIAIWKEFGH